MWRKVGAGLFAAGSLVGGGTVAVDRAVINPYEDKGTHYELPIKADIEQGERVEIAKDRAAMTLKGWNDEYAITVIPQIPSAPTFGADRKLDKPFTVQADRKLLSKKIEFRSGDITAFIEPRENTDNEFDIDFTLDSKPNTNVFEYKIDGADDFDFFYQPALTQKEILRGDEQPDNAIGSYAVYHKTKAHNCINCHTANYATGKIFHIYRPKAIDADGVETWAELHYEAGVLSVTVPHNFLDRAAYPVIVDPTFGYTSQGASALNFPFNDIYAGLYTAPVDFGTLDSISGFVYLSNPGTQNIKYLVISSSGSILTNGIASPTTITNSQVFTTSTFPINPTITASTNYYLGAIRGTDNVNGLFSADITGGTAVTDFSNDYNTPTDPGTGSNAYKLSIYVTYSAAASDTCTYSGSGDWEVQLSDNCYITSDVYVTGALYCFGSGSFAIDGAEVRATASTCIPTIHSDGSLIIN